MSRRAPAIETKTWFSGLHVTFRTVAVLCTTTVFAAIFVLGSIASVSPTRIGVSGVWLPSAGTWQIASVAPISPAADERVHSGDMVVSVDGAKPVSAGDDGDQALESAQEVTLVRPSTGAIVTVRANARSLNWDSVLTISLAFFVVGLAALSRSANRPARALALTSLTAAAELAILPAVYRQDAWALPLHSLFIPLFMASFAYLFLTFPVQRSLRLKRVVVPNWVVPLTAVPFAMVSYYASAIEPELYRTFRGFGAPYLLLCLVVGVISLVLTWRQTKDDRARTQTRLVVSGTLVSILPFLLLSVLPELTISRDILKPKYTVITLVLMPLSFGYAILRYQIMDLQVYVRRGIVYSILALLITGVYALILFVGTTLVQHKTGMNDVFVLAISGTIVALIFQRLRDELQRVVDRAFDRSHYDYRTQLLEFSQRMAEHLGDGDPGMLTVTLISQTLEPDHVRLYMLDNSSQTFRLSSEVGIPASADLLEINTWNSIIDGLEEEGGIRQRVDGATNGVALAILLKKEKVTVGLLTLGSKKSDLPYSSEDLSLLRTVANQLAVAANNSQLYERTRDLYLSSIKSLAATVDAKDPYTHGHSERVSAYSRSIAVALGLEHADVEAIELAGLLHDIGKIGIPDSVLQKPGRLDPDERALIMEHAALGAKIISENPSLMPLAPLVRHHHEWVNGGGYPDGLSGADIPLGAAIISVADTYDTMTTDRPYRAAPGSEKALEELQRCSGSQFHPDVVAAFLSVHGRSTDSEPSNEAAYQSYSVAGRISTVDTRAMHLIYRVVQTIGEVTDLRGFITRVIDLLHREIGTGSVDIYLADSDTGDLICQSPPCESSGIKELRIERGKGLAGWVAEHRVPARVDDTAHDTRGNQGRHPKTRSHLAVPLIIEGHTIGVIDVQSRRKGSFTPDDETLLSIVAQQLAQIIEVAQLHDQVKRNAVLDGLTGVANHRHFYVRLEQELATAIQQRSDVSLILIDVDGLKSINDTYGHIAGDAALSALATLLERESRGTDIVARYGGDEFAIILPGVDEAGALQYAQRMEQLIAESTFTLQGREILLPSVSWGLSSLSRDGERAVPLVAAADERMYRDKFSVGKDRKHSLSASGD